MTDETYQGWPNRETWCVHLWLRNEPGNCDAARMACNQRDETIQEAAQSLKDWVADLWGDKLDGSCPGNVGNKTAANFSSAAKDMLKCALARVNWVEVAYAFREY
jgi:hypothetical protein